MLEKPFRDKDKGRFLAPGQGTNEKGTTLKTLKGNRKMKREMFLGSFVTLSCAALLMIPGCGGDKKGASNTSTNAADKKPFGETTEQNLPGASTETGQGQGFNFDRTAVRNFEELKSSMAVVTCISDSDKLPAQNSRSYGQFFTDLSGNLPTTNDPEKYIAANVVGTMNLASQACILSISLSTASRCEWSAGLRKETDPSEAFTPEKITQLGKAVVQHFWGVDPSLVDNDSKYIEDLKTDIAELQVTIKQQLDATPAIPVAQHNRKIVEGVLVSVCSAALSSAQFTTY